jgi:uncharacterized damage-inducible protein DinB
MTNHEQVLDLLLTGLDEAFDRKAWHGATLWGTLRNVSRDEAEGRPSPERHNIWETAVHCAYWKYIVRRRLTGDRRRTFPLEGSDWFVRPGTDREANWERDRALLREEHEKLRAVVARMSADDLRRRLGSRDPIDEIRGIANHDIYHTGQIRLLRLLVRRG